MSKCFEFDTSNIYPPPPPAPHKHMSHGLIVCSICYSFCFLGFVEPPSIQWNFRLSINFNLIFLLLYPQFINYNIYTLDTFFYSYIVHNYIYIYSIASVHFETVVNKAEVATHTGANHTLNNA